MSVAVIDYGSGNLRSAAKALERVSARVGGAPVAVTNRPEDLGSATHIVLPGVGAYADCRAGLDSVAGMVDVLTEQVLGRGKPFLGICVGMQLMAQWGREHKDTPGLGWIEGEVRALEISDETLKIPHMGWNNLEICQPEHPVMAGLQSGAHVYFVHSYGFQCADPAHVLARTDYDGPVTAVIGRDNMVGTQFHPEKSQAMGLKLLENFLSWRP